MHLLHQSITLPSMHPADRLLRERIRKSRSSQQLDSYQEEWEAWEAAAGESVEVAADVPAGERAKKCDEV